MEHFAKKNLKAGEILIKEGEKSNDLYLLMKGSLKVTITKGTTNYEVETIMPGKLAGEMSFLDMKPRSANVTAFRESTVAVIPRAKYEEFLKTLPDWLLKLQTTIISRLRDANTKIII